MSQTSNGDPKPVTAAELKQLVDRAKNNPSERERLQNDPEAVLQAMGLIASPGAVEFLRTLGESGFDEKGESLKPGTKDPTTCMGES